MSEYKKFAFDLPHRLKILDQEFSKIARKKNIDVSYLLMKLAASFLLPYERTRGTSGASETDIPSPESIRKDLELDKLFIQSSYCKDADVWSCIDVDNFSQGPREWSQKDWEPLKKQPTHKVLDTLRHSLAHANLFFGGEDDIEHIYFGNRRERDKNTNKYRVIRCPVLDLNNLVNAWISNLETTSVGYSEIIDELEKE